MEQEGYQHGMDAAVSAAIQPASHLAAEHLAAWHYSPLRGMHCMLAKIKAESLHTACRLRTCSGDSGRCEERRAVSTKLFARCWETRIASRVCGISCMPNSNGGFSGCHCTAGWPGMGRNVWVGDEGKQGGMPQWQPAGQSLRSVCPAASCSAAQHTRQPRCCF